MLFFFFFLSMKLFTRPLQRRELSVKYIRKHIHKCTHTCMGLHAHANAKSERKRAKTGLYISQLHSGSKHTHKCTHMYTCMKLHAHTNMHMRTQKAREKMSKDRTVHFSAAFRIQIQKVRKNAIYYQSSGAVWKSRWSSLAPVPIKPTVSVWLPIYNDKTFCHNNSHLLRVWILL